VVGRGDAVTIGAAVGVAFSLRVAGLAAVAAALVALAPASARANLVFVHSAKSGELGGGRLTLHGVGRRVTWMTNGGRSGVVSIARLHRRLFLAETPRATGTLHIAGQRGGQELALRLRRPRYNSARQTVRYRIRRLHKRGSARASGFRSRRRFGAASLSIVGSKLVGDNGGLDCRTTLSNQTQWEWGAAGESKWDTDTWDPGIPFQGILFTSPVTWGSDGGLLRGCGNSGTWVVVPYSDDPNIPVPSATVNVVTTYPWSGQGQITCTSSSPQFACSATGYNDSGVASWSIYANY
jgi:hypothetical protein